GDRIGVTGFCMGGRITFLTAASNADIKAPAPFYGGGIGGLLDQAGKITAPMLLFFGDQDPFIPNEEVEKIKATLARLNKPAEGVVYPGATHALCIGAQDPFIPNEEVEKITATLARLNKPAEVVVYPGAPHGFFCNERDSY